MRAKQWLDHGLGGLLVAALGLSVLAVLWQVASRYLLAEPSRFTDELVRYLLVWIGLLGGAHAVGQKLHLSIDLLPGRLEPKRRHALSALVHLLVALFALAVPGLGGARLVAITLDLGQRSAALGVDLGWVYTVLPLSALVIAGYSILFALDHLGQARGGAPRFQPGPGADPGLGADTGPGLPERSAGREGAGP